MSDEIKNALRLARAFGGMAYQANNVAYGMDGGGEVPRPNYQMGGPTPMSSQPPAKDMASDPSDNSLIPYLRPSGTMPQQQSPQIQPPQSPMQTPMPMPMQNAQAQIPMPTPMTPMQMSEAHPVAMADGGGVEALKKTHGPHAIRLHQAIARSGYEEGGPVDAPFTDEEIHDLLNYPLGRDRGGRVDESFSDEEIHDLLNYPLGRHGYATDGFVEADVQFAPKELSPVVEQQNLEERKPLPLRPYEQRYNAETNKLDAPEHKDIGFNGPVEVAPGKVASEYSLDSDIGQYPSIAADMPEDLKVQALNAAKFDAPVPEEAAKFAYDKAVERKAQGRSPFYEAGKDPYPKWSPNQYWEKPAIMPNNTDALKIANKAADAQSYGQFGLLPLVQDQTGIHYVPGSGSMTEFVKHAFTPKISPAEIAHGAYEMIKSIPKSIKRGAETAHRAWPVALGGEGKFDPNNPEDFAGAQDLAGLAMTGSIGGTRPAGALASGLSREAESAAPSMTKSQSQEAMRRLWESGQGDTGNFKTWNHQWNVQEAPKFKQQAAAAEPVAVQNNVPELIGVHADPILNPLGFGSRGWEATHQFLPESGKWSDMQKILTDPKMGAVKPEEMKWADFQFDPAQTVTRAEVADKFKSAFPEISEFKYGYPSEEANILNNLREEMSLAHNKLIDSENKLEDTDLWRYTSMSEIVSFNPEQITKAFEKTPKELHPLMEEYARDYHAYQDMLDKLNRAELNLPSTAVAPHETYTMPGGSNYRMSALTLPHMSEFQGIHPDLQGAYEADLAKVNSDLKYWDDSVKDLQEEYKADINFLAEEMKQQRLQQMYNDPELTEAWERSRKGSVDPSSGSPKDQLINGLAASMGGREELRDKLFNDIVNKEAENLNQLAASLGRSEELYDLRFHSPTYENLRSAQEAVRDARDKKYGIKGLYEDKSQKLWLESQPSYANLDFGHETHLPGAKNPILHNRFKDREYVDPQTGENLKILSHEEQQSDLAKHGQKHGFYDPIVQRKYENNLKLLDKLIAEKDDAKYRLGDDYKEQQKLINNKYADFIGPITKEFENSKKLQSDVDRYNEAYNNLPQEYFNELKEARENYNNSYDKIIKDFKDKSRKLNEEIASIPYKSATTPLPPYMGEERAYHELGIKSALKEALENGYNRIFIPGAAEHARRYGTELRKAIDNVSWDVDPFDATNKNNRFITTKSKGSDRKDTFLVEPVTDEKNKTKYIVKESSLGQAVGQPLSYVLGNDLAQKIAKGASGNIPMENYVMGSEGYKSLYEEKLPARYKHILNQYFGKDAGKVYAGGMPDSKGEIVNGYFVDITPQMIQNYNTKKNKAKFFFYGYKRGGYVPPKNQDALKIANRVR